MPHANATSQPPSSHTCSKFYAKLGEIFRDKIIVNLVPYLVNPPRALESVKARIR